jgi:hypothetical protein
MRIALACMPHVDSTLRLSAQMGASDVVARYPAHRGSTLVTAFDAAELDPSPGCGGPITSARLWDNLAWFLDRIVPVAVPRFRETFHDDGKTDMAECIRAYREIGFTGPARPDHVPTLEGESNALAGYHMMGRLFAVGYMRGLLDATA